MIGSIRFINIVTEIDLMKNTVRGFIFSLDAFIAFTLALVAIYTLIFFSSIPSAYYNSLTQAHYLSKDTLLALSQTKCTYPQPDCTPDISVLDFLILRTDDSKGDIDFFIGQRIPQQFGYAVETSTGGSWTELYNTANGNTILDDPHNTKNQRLTVSSYTVVFDYKDQPTPPENPYSYMTCSGAAVVCDVPISPYTLPSVSIKVVKLTVFI